MTRYIALLRGVNVGGHKAIAMAELRALCSDIGLSDVQTLLQSGNLVFTEEKGSAAALEKKLEQAIDERLGQKIDLIIRTATEWQSLVENNPYAGQAASDPAHLVLALLKKAPAPEAWAALQSAIKGRETVFADERHAYIYYPDGIGNSRLTNALIESKLKASATARNWNTVLKLANLA